MRKLPPLAQLRAFEAAARHMSFKKAAEELAVTPTAISHHVRSLELFCGQSLFRRRPRPMALTEAGARLFPVVRDGLDGFSGAVSEITEDSERHPLTITTTNALASRWLVPRLPRWREMYPGVALEVIGTDSVLDLKTGEADLAIRYLHEAPTGVVADELFRDSYIPVCRPTLLPAGQKIEHPDQLKNYTLIHSYWPPAYPHPPTWHRWLETARRAGKGPGLAEMAQLSFRDELHAIDAAIAGQGIAITSDVLVKRELDSGTLVRAADLTLPGYRYYLISASDHPRQSIIDAFSSWLRSVE